MSEKIRDIKQLGDFLIVELSRQLLKQGHKASGSLINSLEQVITERITGVELKILMNEYGKYVDSGRKAGGRKVPIKNLIDWVIERGIASGSKEARNLAFAIQTTIHKEGSPTKNSRKRGKKTNFIGDALNASSLAIDNAVANYAEKTIIIQLDKL